MIGRDSSTNQYREKLAGDHPQYKFRVAEPVMSAVDAMPREYRALVHEFGYVDVYRAWKRGMSSRVIAAQAERNEGVFVL